MPAKIDENVQFVDDAGKPLVNGKIYIGTLALNPKTNLITIYSDRALTAVLANPQTLDSEGRSTNKIWIPGKYSFRVDDLNDVQQIQDLDAGETVDTGTTTLSNIQGTNAITGEAAPTITAYVDGEIYTFKAANLNTGPITLDVDSVGAKAFKRNHNQDIEGGQFEANQIIKGTYNSTDDVFEWTNQNLKTSYWSESAGIASAATVNLALATGNIVPITGNTGPITSFGTVVAGAVFVLKFASNPKITRNATSMIIPGLQDITMEAGDHLKVKSLGSGNWEILKWTKLAGFPVMSIDKDLSTVAVDNTVTETSIYSFSVPAGMLGVNRLIHAKIAGTYDNGGSGTRTLTVRLKYGATTIATFARSNVAIAPPAGFLLDVYLCADEATGAQKGWFEFRTVDESGAIEPHNIDFGTGAEDSTGALTLDVTVQHSAAAADLTLTKEAAFATLE